jgi:hypothetical protein
LVILSSEKPLKECFNDDQTNPIENFFIQYLLHMLYKIAAKVFELQCYTKITCI